MHNKIMHYSFSNNLKISKKEKSKAKSPIKICSKKKGKIIEKTSKGNSVLMKCWIIDRFLFTYIPFS